MTFSYAVQVVREDGTHVEQVPVRVDWEPAREWLRLKALERGFAPEQAFVLDCTFEPLWDSTRGQPFLAGFLGTPDGDAATRESFPVGYFGELARGITKRMVADGALQKGDLVRCHPVAFPVNADQDPETQPRLGRMSPPRIAIGTAVLADFTGDSNGVARSDEDPLPALIPEQVIREVTALTSAEQGARETGGILIGHLWRDAGLQRLFVEVTAQIPAEHTEASSAKLTFTPATWTAVQAALALRTRGEVMLGWWHSHPVREWCKDCPPEKRATCALAEGFLSEDDRLLHRAVFPRAYSIALVVNDVGESGPTFSLFGWGRGLIEPRVFHLVSEGRHAHAE